MRTLLLLCLLPLAAGPAFAVAAADSPAADQAKTLLDHSGDAVYDGGAPGKPALAVKAGDRSMDDDSTLPAPGPRVGPGPSDLGEPANPQPKADDSKSSGLGGFFGHLDWKTVGFAAGGALLGVGLGLLLGWGWLGIAAVAAAGAVAGWFLPKLF
jgi:hypothetical protein